MIKAQLQTNHFKIMATINQFQNKVTVLFTRLSLETHSMLSPLHMWSQRAVN